MSKVNDETIGEFLSAALLYSANWTINRPFLKSCPRQIMTIRNLYRSLWNVLKIWRALRWSYSNFYVFSFLYFRVWKSSPFLPSAEKRLKTCRKSFRSFHIPLQRIFPYKFTVPFLVDLNNFINLNNSNKFR